MATNGIHSVHALVRLLKSSTDPPSVPGPSKIEIACLAWSDPAFRAANKGEIIGEWVLTLLGQAKKTRGEKNVNHLDPIADSRYWTLLYAVLTTPSPTAARPIKSWLLPLLNRCQLDIIVIELLVLPSSQVLSPARAALGVLWPLAEKKISVDALAECLGAVFNTCTEWEHVDDSSGWICSTVVGAYRNALANAGNKKKLYNSFLSALLPSWLCTICADPSPASLSYTKQLQDSIYAAGTETLFSLDALKQPLGVLFDVFSSPTSSLLPVLPKLCTSFLNATQKHRSALFVSATSAVGGKEGIRKRAMEFVGRCLALIWGSVSLDLEAEKWKSAIGVLRVIEKERLFVVHPIHNVHIDVANGEYAGELVLSQARDKAVEILEAMDASSQDHPAEQVVLAIQLLGVLVQIEYDFVGSVLERILSALVNIPPPLAHIVTIASSEFLTRVLEYHTKTRTVHMYVLALLGAIVASSASPASWAFSSWHMTSTFPLAYHLPALARALRTSLIPTQTTPLAAAVLQAVESAWRTFKDASEEERSTKRQKVAEDTDKNGRETRLISVQARMFSCMSRVAGTVLSNLPPNAYTGNEEYSLEPFWSDVGELGWAIIWDCLKGATRKGGEHKTTRGKKRKHSVEAGTRYPHIVASATLRFLYDVRARVSILLGDCDRLGEAHVGILLNVVRDEVSGPELVLDIIRTLLWHIWYMHNCESQKQMETQQIFTTALDVITARPLSKLRWSGVSATLTRDNLGLSILYVLTERWIDLLDALTSAENLKKLILLLLAEFLDPSGEDTQGSDVIQPQQDHVFISLRGILISLLRNAQFWELHNIRAVLLSSMLTLTAPLSHYCLSTTGAESPSVVTAMARTEFISACNIYNLLHHVPPEYLTRSARTELVKRAMAADIQICTELKGTKGRRSKTERKNRDEDGTGLRGKCHTEESNDRAPMEEFKEWSCRLTFIRTFLQRMGQLLGTPNHSISLLFVNHLLSPPLLPSKALASVTLDLIQLHVVNLLRSQEPGAATSASSIISTLTAAGPFSQPNSQETWTHIIIRSSVLKLIKHLISDFNPASLPTQVKHALEKLLEALESVVSPHSRGLVERDTMELNQFPLGEQINAWSHMLSLTRWLGMNAQVTATPLGLKLAASMIHSEISARLDPETRSSALGLLIEELWCMPDASHRVHLDVLVGFYMVNSGYRGSDAEDIIDAHVIQASKKMSVRDFSYLLDVLEEGIGGSGLQVGYRERLIRLGQVVLHDAPQGTLKVTQHFAMRCFNLFADREEIHGGSSHLKMQCLEFIARYCSDRPAAIRSVDLGGIWTLLNRVLSGSSEHDTTTAFPIFHHITTIIGALIRLRRDLLTHSLPHLSLVLRQLMMLIRKMRPQLGAKQSKIITDTLPSWLSAPQPLSTDEARALARLLTSLTTKTVPRTHAHAHPQTSTQPQKAESLAKPFAKHALYVLVAYVDAFNDPLCIISVEVRRELEPGLFALCEMVGEYGRDALMVSTLDSGGKMILKSLWREYEKQRYVGKG